MCQLVSALCSAAEQVGKPTGGFSGQLMQYRETTDQFADVAINQALQNATE